jgi:hypothetical protein
VRKWASGAAGKKKLITDLLFTDYFRAAPCISPITSHQSLLTVALYLSLVAERLNAKCRRVFAKMPMPPKAAKKTNRNYEILD